jgi:hypothetical protein
MSEHKNLISAQHKNLSTGLLEHFGGMYEGDKDGSGVECLTVVEVRTRQPHLCPQCQREIPSGSVAIREHALVDGCWRTCYTCEACVMRYSREFGKLHAEHLRAMLEEK